MRPETARATQMSNREMLTVKEVATFSRVNVKTVYSEIAAGSR
jgi:hypothetical protein